MAAPSTRRHGPLRPHTVPRCSAGLPSTSDSRRSPRPAAVGSPPRAPSRRRTAGPAERAEPDRDLPDRPPRDPAPHRPYRAWQARRTSDRPGSPRPPPQAPRPAPSPHGTAGPPSMSDRPRPPRPATAAPRPAPSPHGTAGPPSTSDRRPSPRRAARHPCARAPPRRATTGPPSASSPAARRRNGGGPPGRSPWVSRSRAAPAVCGRRVGGPVRVGALRRVPATRSSGGRNPVVPGGRFPGCPGAADPRGSRRFSIPCIREAAAASV
ncbi:hypothetical protein RKD39_000160 [Streptomyces albogriseolus]